MQFRTIAILGAAFATLPGAALAAPVILTATLNGANETGGGDADGSGSFTAEVDADAGDFCYTLKVAGIEPATMAHVHAGAAGANGPPVITVEVAEDTCLAVEPEKLAPILAKPEDFYVNVHNAPFPAGAVRGQLGKK